LSSRVYYAEIRNEIVGITVLQILGLPRVLMPGFKLSNLERKSNRDQGKGKYNKKKNEIYVRKSEERSDQRYPVVFFFLFLLSTATVIIYWHLGMCAK
jgi:hypothetical protein